MRLNFRSLTLRGALSILLAVQSLAHAQTSNWPQRPVRLVVPLAPGGSVDAVARQIAARLSDEVGQQFVVDNRAGAGGVIGTTIVVRAEADGHTLLMMSGAFAANAALYALPYDPLKDIAPVALIASGPFILVAHPSMKTDNVAQLVELARAKPATVHYGSGGPGTATHLTTELFRQTTKVELVHVPYKGGGAAIADLLAGRIQLYMAPGPLVMNHVKSGKLRALGVSSAQRLAALPDVPAIAESLPDFVAMFPYGLGAPARTPQAIVTRLSETVGRIVKQPDVAERLRANGDEPTFMQPAEYARAIEREIATWKRVVEVGKIKPQ
jgi:tripartite-type tricarboxylate transporter receptor subunit TctC